MNIKIHSNELNRMMKTIVQCIDQRDITNKANICITHDDNKLSIRAANGIFSAVMTAPVMGGDGESFCVDGSMFAKVCAMCSGEISIVTDGKTCTVKGLGRTKLPIVNANIPEYEPVKGNTITTTGEKFSGCYGSVAYAIAADQTRIQLTGVLMECANDRMKMVALDGVQMSIEEDDCTGDGVKAIVPGSFMKLIASSTGNAEDLRITFSKTGVQAETDSMMMKCGLLAGEYVDYNRILPKDFNTKVKVNVSAMRDALKAGNVVNSKQSLVKLDVGPDMIMIRNNSESADYEADIPCETNGNGLKIAFNEKYLMNTISALSTDDAVMNMNSGSSPVVMTGMDGKGYRLVLPVRVM